MRAGCDYWPRRALVSLLRSLAPHRRAARIRRRARKVARPPNCSSPTPPSSPATGPGRPNCCSPTPAWSPGTGPGRRNCSSPHPLRSPATTGVPAPLRHLRRCCFAPPRRAALQRAPPQSRPQRHRGPREACAAFGGGGAELGGELVSPTPPWAFAFSPAALPSAPTPPPPRAGFFVPREPGARAEDERRGNTRGVFPRTEPKMASRRACYGFPRSFLPPACFPPARGAASPPLPLFLPPMFVIFLGGAVRPKGGCRRKGPWSSLQRNSTAK